MAQRRSSKLSGRLLLAQRVVEISQRFQYPRLAAAVGKDWKGKLSPVLYFAAIPLAFVNVWIAYGLFIFVAILWLVPDRRIERVLVKRELE